MFRKTVKRAVVWLVIALLLVAGVALVALALIALEEGEAEPFPVMGLSETGLVSEVVGAR